MTRFWTVLALVTMLAWLAPAQAEDPMAMAERIVNQGLTEQNVQACKACHGAQGKSAIPMYPHLAGQYRSYLVHSLKQYRSGARQNPIMTRQAGSLSDLQIQALAGYFATRPAALTMLSK